MMKFVILVILVFVCSLFSPREVKAEIPKSVRVSGFAYPKNRFPLAMANGGYPSNFDFNTSFLYEHLINPSNFGQEGIVNCPIQFNPFINYINDGFLVDINGKIKYDIFFAGETETELSTEEIFEISEYVNSGGILYISGEPNTTIAGPSYNLLLENLDLLDRFRYSEYRNDNYVQSAVPISSQITSGPFGTVGPLKYKSYKIFDYVDTVPVVFSNVTNDVIVSEKLVGKGLVSITGSTIYRNIFIGDVDNRNYFLNLFALGCKTETVPEKVLSVPSFKQGLSPYDGLDPVWENAFYDDGNRQTLWCGMTIGACGCAMTSTAMIMAYNNVLVDPLGNTINPHTVNNYFGRDSKKVNDYYVSWGYSYGNVLWTRVGNLTALANRVYPSQPKLDQAVIENYDSVKLKAYLDLGIPVILKVKNQRGGTHWVVVKGYNGVDFILNDPATSDPQVGSYSTLTSLSYIPQDFRSMIHFNQTNSDFSSLEIYSPESTEVIVNNSLGQKTGFENGNIYEEISNSLSFFDDSYDDDTKTNSVPPTDVGINSLIIRKPEKGEYNIKLNSNEESANFTLYISDIQGNVSFYPFSYPFSNLDVVYNPSGGRDLIRQKIQIDVLPGLTNNWIWTGFRIPVKIALLSSLSFDAVKVVDQKTLTFGKSGDEKSLLNCLRHGYDINNDGLKDLLCFFNSKKFGFVKSDIGGTLKGQSKLSIPFIGKDTVIILN